MSQGERDKLRVLLKYWVEHNREHSQEFREWAEKARASGEAEVAAELLEAVRAMEKTTRILSRSLQRLEEA